MEPIVRVTARVIPVCNGGRALVLLDQDPARPGVLRWGTVGGGIDAGEAAPEAAIRELYEETGIVATTDDLSAPFHPGSLAYSDAGITPDELRQDGRLVAGDLPAIVEAAITLVEGTG